MRKILIILVILLFPSFVSAFELWDENTTFLRISLAPEELYKIGDWQNPIANRFLGFQVIPEIIEDVANLELICVHLDGEDTYYSLALVGSPFIFFNDICGELSIINPVENLGNVSVGIFYIEEEDRKLKTELIISDTTSAEFYLDKTINYGDILVIVFLSIFMIFIITKAIAGFVFKPH